MKRKKLEPIIVESYLIVYLNVPDAVIMKLMLSINFWGDFEVLSWIYYVINNKRMIGKHAVHPHVVGISSNGYYLRAPGNANKIRFQTPFKKKRHGLYQCSISIAKLPLGQVIKEK